MRFVKSVEHHSTVQIADHCWLNGNSFNAIASFIFFGLIFETVGKGILDFTITVNQEALG